MKIRDVKGKVNEGWWPAAPIDRERYNERPGLEGPFQTKAGKTVYYDPKEGAYYDPDSDIYLTYDEWKALDEGIHEADVPGSPYNGMDRETRQIYQNLLYHGGGGSWTAQKAAQAAKNRASLAASADYHVYTQADVKTDGDAAKAKYKEVAALFNKEKAKPASDVGQKRRMMALKKAGDELSNFPHYLGNQAWAEDGYSAIFSGKTPWEELSEMAKANVVRKQAQIKKKKEAINALMTKIGLSPIQFTNMGDVEPVSEDDTLGSQVVRHKVGNIEIVSSQADSEGSYIEVFRDGKRIATGYFDLLAGDFVVGGKSFNSKEDLAANFGGSVLEADGADDGFVRVSSTEFDRIAQAVGAEWVYNMGALMLNGEEVGYRREVDRERDRIWYDYYVRDDLMQGSGPTTQLGDAREVITQPIGSITKRRGSNELELGEDEVERMADRVHANYLFSMTKTDYDNPANSDTKYFKMAFTVPQGGVAHPLALNRQIEENPVYRDLRKQGYEGAKTIAMWKNDIDSELAAAHDKLNDPRPWLPSYKQELTKTVNTLSMAKKIMSSNEVLEGVREAGNPQDVIRKFLDQKQSQERRAADLAKNPQKVNQATSMDMNEAIPRGLPRHPYAAGTRPASRATDVKPGTRMAAILNDLKSNGDWMTISELVALSGNTGVGSWDPMPVTRTSIIEPLKALVKRGFVQQEQRGNKYVFKAAVTTESAEDFDLVSYVGARVAKAGKYSSLRDPNKRTRDEEDAIARKLAAKSKAKPVREVAGYAANGATLLVAQNGKVVQKLQLPLDPKMHHIAQELRKLNLGLNDFEMTSAARDLAGGRTYRKGTLAMQMKASTPTEMR